MAAEKSEKPTEKQFEAALTARHVTIDAGSRPGALAGARRLQQSVDRLRASERERR